MIELREHVERIVRPVRASQWRKDRMREELLTHLTTIYDEELAVNEGDASAALAIAAERFGDPGELRGELQASVPWFEQVLFASLPLGKGMLGRRPGESTSDYVRRGSLWSIAFNAVIWGLLILVVWTMHGRRPERAHEASLGWFAVFGATYVVCLFPVAVFGMIVLLEWTWRTLEAMRGCDRASRRRLAGHLLGYLLAASLLYATVAAASLTLIARTVTMPLISDFWFCVIVLVTGLTGPVLVLSQIPDIRRWYRWEGLDLATTVPGNGNISNA